MGPRNAVFFVAGQLLAHFGVVDRLTRERKVEVEVAEEEFVVVAFDLLLLTLSSSLLLEQLCMEVLNLLQSLAVVLGAVL